MSDQSVQQALPHPPQPLAFQPALLGAKADSSSSSSGVDGGGDVMMAGARGGAQGSGKRSVAEAASEEDVCWLCLGGEEEGLGPLAAPCRCPRLCHPGCLSRWQLHCAGRQEEKLCRFCGDELPDWRHVPPAGFAPDGAAAPPPPAVEAPPAYMRISYNGRSHKIRVRPGPDGTRQFIEDCRQLLKIPSHLEFDVVFHCKEPATQSDLRFRGLEAFDAAVYCASLANHAAALQQQQQQQVPQPEQQLPLPPAAPCPLPPPPPPPRALVRATSEMADELARMAAAAEEEEAAAAAAAAAFSAAAESGERSAPQGMFGPGDDAMVLDNAPPPVPPPVSEQQQQQRGGFELPVGGVAAGAPARAFRSSSSRTIEDPLSGPRSHVGTGMGYSQGRSRRQRRADGLSSNMLMMPIPRTPEAAADAAAAPFSSPYSAEAAGAGGPMGGNVAGGHGMPPGGVTGGSGSGHGGGVGPSLASIAAAAVGSVLGAFRRCGSWEGP